MANNDKVVVTNKKSFLGSVGSAIASIPAGIILLIIGVIFLANNEKINVNNIKNVKELRDQVVDVSSSSVDDKYDGKLIATSGKLTYNDAIITDDAFNISVSTPVLVRTVEVYQWVETSDTVDDKTTYSYSKEWSEKIIDSSDFNTVTGHENPVEVKYESERFETEETLKVGAYNLISSFKSILPASKNVGIDETTVLPEGYKIYNKYITNSVDTANPAVGDIRVSYTKNDYKDVSVLGKQNGDTIGEYTTKKNTNIKKIVDKETNGAGMINSIESANKTSKWVKRIIGAAMIMLAISFILGPITTIIGYIPFLGKLVNSMIGVVSFLIGLIISLLVIAISWFVVRPLLSGILLAVIVGLTVGIIYIKKNKAEPAEKTN